MSKEDKASVSAKKHVLGSKHNPHKVSRTEALDLLDQERSQTVLRDGKLFGMTVVVADSQGQGPHVELGSFRFGVGSHLHGGLQCGSPNYKAEDQGKLNVYKMHTRRKALKIYEAEARQDLEESEAELPAARERLSKAYNDYAMAPKVLKRHTQERDVAKRAVEALEQKIALARLKLTDPAAAAQQGLEKKIANRTAEIGKAQKALAQAQDQTERTKLEDEIASLERRRDKDEALLDDPIKSLLASYRTYHQTGIVGLRIRGQHYTVTTPPTPALPDSGKKFKK